MERLVHEARTLMYADVQNAGCAASLSTVVFHCIACLTHEADIGSCGIIWWVC